MAVLGALIIYLDNLNSANYRPQRSGSFLFIDASVGEPTLAHHIVQHFCEIRKSS